jgi:glycerol-3-phosphate dehydrogenase
MNSGLPSLGNEVLDAVIIGGGIVGAGIIRDCAMRGLAVALLEERDLAFGTSSRSSRLLHGGLRYLAQGRLGLVREASVEKRVLHRIAPHLAEPLGFVFPTRRGDRDWPLWQLKLGVKLYDALCGWQNLGRSEWLSREQATQLLPHWNPEGLNGAVRYFDAMTSDARLVFDTLRSAAHHGAIVSSRTGFASAARDGSLWRVVLCDGRELRSRWIINAAGPWAGGWAQSQLQLRLTKGVHLVVDRRRLDTPDAVVLTEGRRILFCLPWGRRTIIGTTDTDYSGDAAHADCAPEDVAYLLRVVNARFPAAGLQPGDILSAWAGVRPLVAGRGGHPSDASRSHVILRGREPWLDVAGGKLTTYRLIAQQATDMVARALGNRAVCRTAEEPLVPPQDADGVSSVIPPAPMERAVRHYCEREWAQSLEDVMVRRTSWHFYLDDAPATARQVAAWMAPVLKWDALRTIAEVQKYEALHAAMRRQITHRG